MKVHETKKELIEWIPQKTGQFETAYSFETEDGEIFKDKDRAQAHENELRYKATVSVDFGDVFFDALQHTGIMWHIARDAGELDFLKKYLTPGYCDAFGWEKVGVGEWFTTYFVPSADQRDILHVTTFKEIESIVNVLRAKFAETVHVESFPKMESA